ncbi:MULTISPECIES: HD domain-containing phosphohydrolase [unclassified Pseudodesulfovibrio]|uniref:HD domain-containing phosphohydrolase n=1 Tax=unclassified Pseudodesulfovibrio TaxID=2661612 RepID=UPI000FEBA54C|nr:MULTISPECIES: HD domain-containing phosphohydrolase [unclassified Pseudodesulfovibrio]MCJ2163467.1 PAS domain-containing protein [Pseudodesulfovibrio sp. S3-i]RWU06704.1 histidine kinase [Pseudodesulfovibrio sp. S3]
MAEQHSQTASEVPKSIGGAGQGVKIAVVLAFVLVISVGILLLANKAVSDKESGMLENQHKRFQLLTQGRVEVIGAWLVNLSQQGDRLIKSDLFRLYAAEIDAYGEDLSSLFGAIRSEDALQEDGEVLAEQLPMMENMLREFSTYAGFLNARILNKKGEAYIATDGHLPPMNEDQQASATAAIMENSPQYSALRKTAQGLEMDVFVPIYPPDAVGGTEEGPREGAVGALMMTRQVSGEITELLSNSPLAVRGEKTRLMQKIGPVYREVTPWTADGFIDVTSPLKFAEDGHLLFGVRPSIADDTEKVFSLGIRIPGPAWWLVQEIDYDAAMNPVEEFNRTVYIVAGLGILTAFLIAGLAWWILTGVQSQRIAGEFKALASQIDDQKRFIDSINANIDEFITLKDTQGKFTYVNDAFAAAASRPKEELIGMDAAAVFGFDTAKRLGSIDDVVIRENRKETISEPIFLRSQRHQFQISKSPYCNAAGVCEGIVEVYRDITEFVAAQEKNKRLIKNAMEALGSTIEAADPYLGGHTKLLAGLSVEVAKAMHLSEMDIAEIETAANLSQIGKMFVPNEILTKPGKLTDEEMATMEEHVEHAYRILKDIDIAEGVLTAIYQMNERLDGTGYPKKIKENDIIMLARILSVLNVFCAMIRPRAYRGAKEPQQALDILSSESSKFDSAVVAALANVITTPAGERLLSTKD